MHAHALAKDRIGLVQWCVFNCSKYTHTVSDSCVYTDGYCLCMCGKGEEGIFTSWHWHRPWYPPAPSGPECSSQVHRLSVPSRPVQRQLRERLHHNTATCMLVGGKPNRVIIAGNGSVPGAIATTPRAVYQSVEGYTRRHGYTEHHLPLL